MSNQPPQPPNPFDWLAALFAGVALLLCLMFLLRNLLIHSYLEFAHYIGWR